ncbi:hypothetical protein [Rhizobium sp. SSA_523]|uniref:hypothetical protein n=1 Tax=Rhizobium sp. SSA_523 TaxID=2952477 RepID=UPI0020916FCB|nr:hypothetical protein [Rhizobium sp. SSA_523]MCO5732742.1 hypothetical protein [Rhizobium sp. SSA_523]WKC23637.1 hypothetical protein QTJ18_23050 [Rhizobium sp. SSA_523]
MTTSLRHSTIAADERGRSAGLWSRFLPSLLAYCTIVIAAILVFHIPDAADYVGKDNDDAMRLVEIRDWLSGQGWFDLMQYRLGLDGGTLMHWSRLIDLPIGLLIRLFSLFAASPEQAEALALTVWPLSWSVLFIAACGLGGRNMGGVATMHIAFGLAALFVFSSIRFHPGSIDHHNVQQTLMVFLAACLIDRRRQGVSHAVAGVAAALAIAIGAETMPIVACACACVAVQWAYHGEAFGRPARAFGLSLAVSVTAFFVATVPPAHYAAVTCDNLSLAFYSLSALGGAGLFLLAQTLRGAPQAYRFLALGALGAGLLLAAGLIAPQCLSSPLADLDPMLRDLWLNNVTEAQPFLSQLQHEPATVGGFYAVGLFAIAVCIFRILDREMTEIHLLLLALISVAWLVSLIQVRGAFLSNALTILPLSLIINDLRRQSHAEPENMNAGFAYAITVLMSVPLVWVFVGAVSTKGLGNAVSISALTEAGSPRSTATTCTSAGDMRALSALPAGVVVAPSESGTAILRHTGHRVLTAPYHRNQAGMLTELHIGLASPDEAMAFLNGAGATILAFCATDPQVRTLIRLKPEGLYASLARGSVPAYLKALPLTDSGPDSEGFRLYQILR